jgi:hypothetical protein
MKPGEDFGQMLDRLALVSVNKRYLLALENVASAAQIIKGYESFEESFAKLGKSLDDALTTLDKTIKEKP